MFESEWGLHTDLTVLVKGAAISFCLGRCLITSWGGAAVSDGGSRLNILGVS